MAVGLSFLNSQGTRTTSLVASAFSLRLICRNGAVAKDNVFSVRYVHKGNLRRNDSCFGKETERIYQQFSLMMKSLPRLGEIPVTEKFIHQIRPALVESLNVKESEEFIKAINIPQMTVMDVWNKVTNLPHRISDPQTKLKLEQLGFKILTLNLCYNRN